MLHLIEITSNECGKSLQFIIKSKGMSRQALTKIIEANTSYDVDVWDYSTDDNEWIMPDTEVIPVEELTTYLSLVEFSYIKNVKEIIDEDTELYTPEVGELNVTLRDYKDITFISSTDGSSKVLYDELKMFGKFPEDSLVISCAGNLYYKGKLTIKDGGLYEHRVRELVVPKKVIAKF